MPAHEVVDLLTSGEVSRTEVLEAALATGAAWLGHGSDLAGSLRTPAAFCGVVGLRPSPGIAGPGPQGNGFHLEAVQGPMARSVRDCALFLDAMAGFDPHWAVSFPPPDRPYQQAVLQAEPHIRIAFSSDLTGFAPCIPAVEAHLRRALGRAWPPIRSSAGSSRPFARISSKAAI